MVNRSSSSKTPAPATADSTVVVNPPRRSPSPPSLAAGEVGRFRLRFAYALRQVSSRKDAILAAPDTESRRFAVEAMGPDLVRSVFYRPTTVV
jgi:hypothetical protein